MKKKKEKKEKITTLLTMTNIYYTDRPRTNHSDYIKEFCEQDGRWTLSHNVCVNYCTMC